MTILMEQVGKSQILLMLDLKLDFNLLHIAQEDDWKTVFKTRYGLYKYAVMPFGLTKSPSAFQWLLNNILAQKID